MVSKRNAEKSQDGSGPSLHYLRSLLRHLKPWELAKLAPLMWVMLRQHQLMQNEVEQTTSLNQLQTSTSGLSQEALDLFQSQIENCRQELSGLRDKFKYLLIMTISLTGSEASQYIL
uniref:Uncharacterized protein n=1 Tax=viral metagenome TaxID=1070528 RepID=A0A2V0R9L8_9ZZZZ